MNNTHTYCNAQRPDARQGTVTTNTDNNLINRLDIIASFNLRKPIMKKASTL